MTNEQTDGLHDLEKATACAVSELKAQEELMANLVGTGWRGSALKLLSHALRAT